MSEFKGTKGKWDIDSSSDSRVELVGGLIDVWIYGKSGDIDIMEAKANAQLISKAPEMLRMLQSIVDDFEGDYVMEDGRIVDNPYPWLIDRYKQAKQIIKEATTI